jgi:hypothetical protein
MKKHLLILLLLTLLLANCNGQSLTEMLNGTATPTATATSTPSPIPTSTHTPQPTATAVPVDFTIPDNFIEKPIPEIGLTIAMPDDWFYLYEKQQNTSAFFVSKEDIEEYGRFSTGLSVNILSDIEDPAVIINNYIDGILMADTTKEIYTEENSYLDNSEKILFRACVILAELEISPNDPNPSPEKKIIYMGIADPYQKIGYLIIFESPSSEWNDAWLNNGVYITQSVISSIDSNFLSLNNN